MLKRKHGKYIEVKTENGWKKEHRYVMESHLGRLLEKNEVVHHIDGDKSNNDVDNLVVMDRAEHTKMHNSVKREEFYQPNE
jgi:hypothetical protein